MKRATAIILTIIAISLISGCSKNAGSNNNGPELSQIRSICNLATLECYYHNVAKSKKPRGSGISHIGETDRKFWIEYTGVAKIGIDMSKVDMKINGENVIVYIPNAELLSIDISENDFDEKSFIISEDSRINKNKITAEDQTSAIKNAQSMMEESVKENKTLLLNAQNRAQNLIENYIIRLGQLSNIEYKIEWVYEKNSADGV